MIFLGLGMDLVDIAHLESRLSSDSFRRRVFTMSEIEIANQRRKAIECYAGKFAVKEAVLKCLGAGIRQGIWFTQIEVLNEPSGSPHLILYKEARRLADEKGIQHWKVSISHTHQTAGAVVLAFADLVT